MSLEGIRSGFRRKEMKHDKKVNEWSLWDRAKGGGEGKVKQGKKKLSLAK